MVQRALEGLPGIRQAEVSLEDGQARVAYDPAGVTVAQMVRAIEAAGFRARPRRAS